MRYNEKLQFYFKKQGISQIELAKRLGHSPAMISRFLSGVSTFDANFVAALIREFPDVDLKYIFSENMNVVDQASEPNEEYGIKEENVVKELEEIENKISIIRKVLAQSCHKK